MSSRSRQTGAVIRIEASDNESGMWTCICEAHDECCDFYSRTEAKQFAAAPIEWCGGCYNHNESLGK